MKTVDEYIQFMEVNGIFFILWTWVSCPLDEKYSLGHGGDEDYVILYNSNHYMCEQLLDKATICDHNSTQFVGSDYILSVTAHA